MKIISVLYTATLLATAGVAGTPAEASVRAGTSDSYAMSGAVNVNGSAANATDNSFDDIVLADNDMSTIIDAAKSSLVKNRRHLRSHR